MTLVIGLDCATLEQKTGLARGTFDGSRLLVDAVSLGSRETPVVEPLLQWIRGAPPGAGILLCIDAPLGWPSPMGRMLPQHQAGDPLPVEPNQFFRRQTDRFVREMLGKLPLDVGADRIARTAHRALAILAEIRTRSGLSFPLPLAPRLQHQSCAIEVYPAATLLAHRFTATGYKGARGRDLRRKMLEQLRHRVDFQVDLALPTGSDDAFDAVVCLLAGMDFLQGGVYAPPDPDIARREGWIWVKKKELEPLSKVE